MNGLYYHFGIITYLILIFFVASCSVPKTITESKQSKSLEKAIQLSAKYLQKSVKENGMFEYRINTDPTIEVKQKYNILRHAGTIYAMSQCLELYPNDKEIRTAIEQAGRYLQNKAIEQVPGKKEMLAVWSKPEINNSGRPLEVKLGGTGLGLVALLSIEKFHQEFTPLSDLRILGNFIVYMQREDGSFYSKYIPAEGGRSDKWTSLYYPGEAALGLLMLYEKDKSALWVESAFKALKYIAQKNSDAVVVDHWYLIATEKMLNLNNYNLTDQQRDLLISHAARICEKIIDEQIISHKYSEFRGGFAVDGRITPSSIRLEGLLAASAFLPNEYREFMRINSAIDRGISFLQRAQIEEGQYAGAYRRALRKLDGDTVTIRNFNRRVTEIRIDYVQHALSALLGYVNYSASRNMHNSIS